MKKLIWPLITPGLFVTVSCGGEEPGPNASEAVESALSTEVDADGLSVELETPDAPTVDVDLHLVRELLRPLCQRLLDSVPVRADLPTQP